MASKKVNAGVYIVGGTIITMVMGTIKVVGWLAHKAVVVYLLHQ